MVPRCDATCQIKDTQVLIQILTIGFRHSGTSRAKHCPRPDPPKTSTRRNVLKRLGSTPGWRGIVLRVQKAPRYCQYTKYRLRGGQNRRSPGPKSMRDRRRTTRERTYMTKHHISVTISSLSPFVCTITIKAACRTRIQPVHRTVYRRGCPQAYFAEIRLLSLFVTCL